MRRSWIKLAALLAGVIALGLFVWLKPPQPQELAYAVSTLTTADAHTLRVQHKGKLLAVLEKHGSDWYLIEPLKAPADAFQVLRLLEILKAKSPLRYPSSDLAKFDLNAPQAELVINDQRFAFGAINTVTREQYMLTQNQVYPLQLRFAAAVPADSSALLRRSVLAPGDTPQRFEFDGFTVSTDGRKWSATPPLGDISQDDYNRWVAQWREGSALRAEAVDSRKPFSKPLSEVHITLNDGAKLTLNIVRTEPELIVRRADLGLQFVFVGDVGTRMMSPPAPGK